jgi:hypothetical protein
LGFGTLVNGPDIGLEIGPDIGSFNFAPTINRSLFIAKSLFALNNEAKACGLARIVKRLLTVRTPMAKRPTIRIWWLFGATGETAAGTKSFGRGVEFIVWVYLDQITLHAYIHTTDLLPT